MPKPGFLPGQPRPIRLRLHAVGTLVADGSEQIVTEATSLMMLSGYIDLSNMEAGDQVVIRQYMRIKGGEPYKKYAQETYHGMQDPPLVFITTKVITHGAKITLQQTAGVLKLFDYSFVREE